MQPCTRSDLICVLPLGVDLNRAGKRRFIWDGSYVNAHLRERISVLRVKTLCGNCTAFMGHTVRFLRYVGIQVLPYLDDLIFAATTAREALTIGQMLLRILLRFGWLIHPTKCVGFDEHTARFVALGTLVDFTAQKFFVPANKLEHMLSLARDVAERPDRVPGPARVVARLKGLITSLWVAVGNATRVRTQEMDQVIESRPPALSFSRRDPRRSWNASVELLPARWEEIRWWANGGCVICAASKLTARPSAQPVPGMHRQPRIRRCQQHGRALSFRWRDWTHRRLSLHPSSGPYPGRPLQAPSMSHDELVERARRGIEFMTTFPPLIRDDSSTLKELWGVLAFVMATGSLLAGVTLGW